MRDEEAARKEAQRRAANRATEHCSWHCVALAASRNLVGAKENTDASEGAAW
jgi:hypothetical protein